MKTEFSENYDEFFKGAIGELQKTITIKLYAIELCNETLNAQVRSNHFGLPVYDVTLLTNQQLNEMSHEEVM